MILLLQSSQFLLIPNIILSHLLFVFWALFKGFFPAYGDMLAFSRATSLWVMFLCLLEFLPVSLLYWSISTLKPHHLPHYGSEEAPIGAGSHSLCSAIAPIIASSSPLPPYFLSFLWME